MDRILCFLSIVCLTSTAVASPVTLNADPSFKGNYINFFAYNQSNDYPSQNDLVPLGQLGPQHFHSAGQNPIHTLQSSGVQVTTAKVQVTIVLANSTKPVQTFCSTDYYDFSIPTTVHFDTTHSKFNPGPCAAEITNVISSDIY